MAGGGGKEKSDIKKLQQISVPMISVKYPDSLGTRSYSVSRCNLGYRELFWRFGSVRGESVRILRAMVLFGAT